jgi:hypothetical protein
MMMRSLCAGAREPTTLRPQRQSPVRGQNCEDRARATSATHPLTTDVDDMNAVVRCLHALQHWSGDDVHEVVVTLGVLDRLAERHGRRTDDFYELQRRPTPLPEGVRTRGLDGDVIWFGDRSGNTLIIDRRGRLVEGPTVAERLGPQIPSELAAIYRAREIERDRIETAVMERLWGTEEEAREAEEEMAGGALPF